MEKNVGHRRFCRFGGRTFGRTKLWQAGFELFQMNCGCYYTMQEMSTSTWGINRESGRILRDEGCQIAPNCLLSGSQKWGRTSRFAFPIWEDLQSVSQLFIQSHSLAYLSVSRVNLWPSQDLVALVCIATPLPNFKGAKRTKRSPRPGTSPSRLQSVG